MAKSSKKTDVAESQTQKKKDRKVKAGCGRIVGSRWHYLLVLIFGAMLTVGIWAMPDQVLIGDDYAFHVSRLQSASLGWANGQIVPQVDPGALGGFGYAYNLFYGPLVTYMAAGLEVLIGVWPIVINLILILCLLGAGFTMCYAMTKISKNRGLALLVAVIYMASPYLLNDIYARMALGEVMAAVAAPILLLGLYQLTIHEKRATRNLAIAAAWLILSHSLSALMFALMAAVYVLINLDKIFNVRTIWRMFLAVIVALGLTAGFTLPLIEAKMEGDYGVFDQSYAEAYFGANPQSVNDHRVWPQELLILDYADSEHGIILGVMALIGVLGFWFIRRTIEAQAERRFVTSLYIIGMLAVIMTLPLIDWHYLPSIAWNIQFPWRFMLVAMTTLAVVAGYTLFALIRRVTAEKQAVVVVVLSMIAVYVVAPVTLPKSEGHLAEFSEVAEDMATLGYQAEYAPMGLLCDPDNAEDLEQGYVCSLLRARATLSERGMKLKVVEGRARLGKATKDGLKVEFEVRNGGDSEALVELPLIWYPGYRAELNGTELEVERSEDLGLVVVKVSAGEQGVVKVEYGLSQMTKLGGAITIVTAGMGVIWVVGSGIHDWRKRRKQQEVDSLVNSVREAMAEGEKVQKKRAMTKQPARKKATMKKTTVKAKSTRIKTETRVSESVREPSDSLGEAVKPRVTKVKARAKREEA